MRQHTASRRNLRVFCILVTFAYHFTSLFCYTCAFLVPCHNVALHDRPSHLRNNNVPDDVNLKAENDDDATRRLIETQQKQIESLMNLVKENSMLKDDRENQSNYGSQVVLPPLKVMLFIDGTWLYYTLHERDDGTCPIQGKFGSGWQLRYYIDWVSLPRVIGRALQQQDRKSGWLPGTSGSGPRPVEVVRVSVYTSFRTDTSKTSFRYQMFQDMIEAKYDVLMLETIGQNEKCVDIQLAVDMLHYATVPDSYDVALLLTGDKDFIPAMVRSRQKGRRVGLVSTRLNSNRAFYETPNIKDYDVILLDDYLDEIIKPRKNAPTRMKPTISEYTMMKIAKDFVECSGSRFISSRDMGRYLKSITISGRSVLEDVKKYFGGLYQFLILSKIFTVETGAPTKSFSVGLQDKAVVDQLLEKSKQVSSLSVAENEFFKSYSLEPLADKKTFYEFTMSEHMYEINAMPLEPALDYDSLKVSELKEMCKEKGLKVSGKKSELVDRLKETVEKNVEPVDGVRGAPNFVSTLENVEADVKLEPKEYLESLLLEYLRASGGKASSRDVGRYLTANKPTSSTAKLVDVKSALQELKYIFGSLRQFVERSDTFTIKNIEGNSSFEFMIESTITNEVRG